MPRLIRVLLVLVLTVAAFPLLTAAPAASYEIVDSDMTADRSRTFADDDSGDLFSISFTTTTANEPRRIYGRVVGTVPSSVDDDIMLSSATIKCWGPGETKPVVNTRDRTHQLNSQRNVLRGETKALSLRWTYIATNPGRHHCVLHFDTVRPRPILGADPREQVIFADNGSYLRATSMLHPAHDAQRIAPIRHRGGVPISPADFTILRESDPNANLLMRTWKAPQRVDRFAVNADVMMTSCTHEEGTPGEDDYGGCLAGDVNRDGGTVNTNLVVGQFAKNSTTEYCAVNKHPGRYGENTFISRNRHHETIRSASSFTVSDDPECSRRFRIYLSAQWKSGASVKVHDYSATSAVVPPAIPLSYG